MREKWRLEVTYNDGSKKTIPCSNKFDAGMKRDTYRHKPDVKYADAFEGDDYIDPIEL